MGDPPPPIARPDANRATRRDHLLVVHGDEQLREALAGILSRQGHAVATAPDVEEAIAMIDEHPPAVLIVAPELPSGPYDSVLAGRAGPPATIIFNAPRCANPNVDRDPRIVAVLDPPWTPEDLSRAIQSAKRSCT